jgi:hypothetical protein
MADLDKVKRNVAKMVGMNAPESDIDSYIASQGTSIDEIKNYKVTPESKQTILSHLGDFAKSFVEPNPILSKVKTSLQEGVGNDVSNISEKFPSIAQKPYLQKPLAAAGALAQTAYEMIPETPIDVAASVLPFKGVQKAIGKVGAGIEKIVTPKTALEKSGQLSKEATEMYRTMLRPNQMEVKNIEIRGGKNIDDFYKLAAEEKLPIKSTGGKDPKLDTEEARKIVMDKLDKNTEQLNNILENHDKSFDLESVRNKSISELKSKYKNAAEYEEAVKDVNSYIDAEIRQSGSNIVSAVDLNNIKQGMWQVGYNAMKPTASKTARTIGHIAKEEIEKGIPDKAIKALNDISGKYATLNNLLENAQGRVIQGGRLGGYFARATGAIAGHSTGIPVIGPLAGEYIGGKLASAIYAPERASRIASNKMAQSQKYLNSLKKDTGLLNQAFGKKQ